MHNSSNCSSRSLRIVPSIDASLASQPVPIKNAARFYARHAL
jgi:hypothetical protein